MGRLLLKDPKPLVQSFICPVTQCDSVKYTGCEAHNAKFRGTHGSCSIMILARFKCACGKNLLCKVLVGGREMTPQRYAKEGPAQPEVKSRVQQLLSVIGIK